MEHVDIRMLTYEDLANLESYFGEPKPGSHEKRLDKQAHGEYSYYGLFDDGKLVATTLVRWSGPVSDVARTFSDLPEISSAFMLPEYRGMGLYSMLLNEIESDIAARGYRGIGAAIQDDNIRSIIIHEKRGYLPVGSIEPRPNKPDVARRCYIKRL